MNMPTVTYLSLMLTVIGLAALTYGMFLWKNKTLCIIGISIMAIAMTVGWTASSFVIQTALQETQAQK